MVAIATKDSQFKKSLIEHFEFQKSFNSIEPLL